MSDIQIGIIMGSQSDWPTLREAAVILDELELPYEARIVSAHRTPDRLWEYGRTAAERGLKVIIAGAGGAAHLPGMMASKTRVPVIGVPVQTKGALGRRLALFHRPDAARLPGGDHGHRGCGRGQCGAHGGCDPGHAG